MGPSANATLLLSWARAEYAALMQRKGYEQLPPHGLTAERVGGSGQPRGYITASLLPPPAQLPALRWFSVVAQQIPSTAIQDDMEPVTLLHGARL